jgi:hypothetical protein
MAVFIFYWVLTLLTSCAIQEPISYVDTQYNKNMYKRVAILVNRMGNIKYQFPIPITLETDYANRVPRPSDSAKGFPGLNVCIEDQNRINESIPSYPHYKPYSYIFKYIKYYKNITSQITYNVIKTLSDKGYHTIEVKELAKDWPQPILEMTVQDIIINLKGKADILFVLHYTDKGSFKVDTISTRRECVGFTELCYTVSIFDIQNAKRVLFEELNVINPLEAIIGDPALQSDSELKQKIQIRSYRENSSVEMFLSDDEFIDLTMKYMRKGLVYEHYISSQTVTIKGLEEIIP